MAYAAAPAPAPAPAGVCAGITLFTQIYDDAARGPADELRRDLDDRQAGALRAAPIENVTRSAQLRGGKLPVPLAQPTLITHGDKVRPCAEALQATVASRWCPNTGACVRITALPPQLKPSPGTLELWLPTRAQDRAAAAAR